MQPYLRWGDEVLSVQTVVARAGLKNDVGTLRRGDLSLIGQRQGRVGSGQRVIGRVADRDSMGQLVVVCTLPTEVDS